MKNYAYISSDGILRITDDEELALKRSINLRCVETDIEFADGGYPVAEILKDGERVKDSIIVYNEFEMKFDAQWFGVKPLENLGELYKKCRGFSKDDDRIKGGI